MTIAGIIAEYNPFHTGHAWHIAETRRALGGDAAVVCAMSGAWVQRGEAAISDPWQRAAAALQNGADLVLYLPALWSAASAEAFARGGVGLLAATGVVEVISFGSETGELAPLQAAASCMAGPEYTAALRAALATGISFAAARQRAVRACIGAGADCLSGPNNNLAVEYLRALPHGITPLTIPRAGAGHDAAQLGEYASASALRTLLRTGKEEQAAAYLPAGAPEGRYDLARCQRAVLARLRSMTAAEFDTIDPGGEGLGRRLYKAVQAASTLDEVYTLAKCKRHAHARLRRMALWAFLGLDEAARPAQVPYLHVLGMTPRGQAVLRQMKEAAQIPVLAKPARAAGLEGAARAVFETESRCMDLFALCAQTPPPCGRLWRMRPVLWP